MRDIDALGGIPLNPTGTEVLGGIPLDVEASMIKRQKRAEDYRKKNIKVMGDFVLEIDSGGRNLEMVTLDVIRERRLQETGNLAIAIAPYSGYFGATAIIPKDDIPLDAVAYRIGKHKCRSHPTTLDTEVYVPVSFYKK